MEELCPDFSHALTMIPEPALGDFLSILTEQNAENVASAFDPNMPLDVYNTGDFTISEAVIYMFNLSKILEQPAEVRHLALAMFDRFLPRHIEDILLFIYMKLQTAYVDCWGVVEVRFYNQLPLRVLSCIQIASKLLSMKWNVVTAVQISEVSLSVLGRSFSAEVALKSELRVLSTLEYKLQDLTPITYVETYILDLVPELQAIGFDPEDVYDMAVSFMDFLAIYPNEIFAEFSKYLLAEGADCIAVQKPAMMKDFALLASAAILCAVNIGSWQTYVLDLLVPIAKVSRLHFACLCAAIEEYVQPDVFIMAIEDD